jgi:hypothetical protein
VGRFNLVDQFGLEARREDLGSRWETYEREREAYRRFTAAAGVGHPEWADLPVTREHIDALGQFFTGRRLPCGHISAQMAYGGCATCIERGSNKGKVRLTSQYRALAVTMKKTGCVCYHDRQMRVVETRVRLRHGGIDEAVKLAHTRHIATGRRHCVVNGVSKLVVKETRR